ncbi:MAG: Uma2 family endonuclease [Candidatus Viridilinea halotolerans]|uniref:Uma2 family endonuclease n=1 Tax=Candidatus Viridilinea halotolerans TaxID=2491704 RepID=A0A426U074_9CHLR|nr:MAG: Uma2 family endonuclease [Candidatus Viridilinea halotolerans]
MTSTADKLELKLIQRAYEVELDLNAMQGLWTEAQYLKLAEQTNHLLEFTDGRIEGLPMPTRSHQLILLFLYELFNAFLRPRGGIVLVAPMRLRIRAGKWREPDLLLLLSAADPRNQENYWLGADLVVEIVSPDRPEHDLTEKPRDYAEATIPEYWIVNPLNETITVLTLDGTAYREHGIFQRGETATSPLIAGCAVAVDGVFGSVGVRGHGPRTNPTPVE